MKQLLLLSLILLLSCKDNKIIKNNNPIKADVVNFDWLIGQWKRTNEEKGKNTYENWIKKSTNQYQGLGFTMQGKDTLSKENMQLIKTNNQDWKLIVRVVGKGDDTSATPFKLIQKDSNSFTFENKNIDFPNTIHYEIKDNKIKATIANSTMTIPFLFERLNKH